MQTKIAIPVSFGQLVKSLMQANDLHFVDKIRTQDPYKDTDGKVHLYLLGDSKIKSIELQNKKTHYRQSFCLEHEVTTDTEGCYHLLLAQYLVEESNRTPHSVYYYRFDYEHLMPTQWPAAMQADMDALKEFLLMFLYMGFAAQMRELHAKLHVNGKRIQLDK